MTNKEIRDMVEEAYFEGHEDGVRDQSRYEWGNYFRGVKDCWDNSDTKVELEKL